jgi:hypothetical protein
MPGMEDQPGNLPLGLSNRHKEHLAIFAPHSICVSHSPFDNSVMADLFSLGLIEIEIPSQYRGDESRSGLAQGVGVPRRIALIGAGPESNWSTWSRRSSACSTGTSGERGLSPRTLSARSLQNVSRQHGPKGMA